MSSEQREQSAPGLVLEQRLRYTYTEPIRNLEHRLMVVPRAVHGEQVRAGWELRVSGTPSRQHELIDSFGNLVLRLEAEVVPKTIEFHIWARVEGRSGPEGEVALDEEEASQDGDCFRGATGLTAASPRLLAAAHRLKDESDSIVDFAQRTCAWARASIEYRYGITDVRTTAAEALEGGYGVCQDYAHIMLALCRAASVPARYVSGHLVGEGGSHAWVEVVSADRAIAFDPTHGRRAGADYLTVAVGRDYADVAPTAGTFDGDVAGQLRVRKTLRPSRPPIS